MVIWILTICLPWAEFIVGKDATGLPAFYHYMPSQRIMTDHMQIFCEVRFSTENTSDGTAALNILTFTPTIFQKVCKFQQSLKAVKSLVK